MQYEIRRIEQVPFLVPNDTYHYTLCPHTAFDGSNKLTPILDNTTISCGSNGWSGHNCTLVGGTVQVNIVETPWFADYPVRRLVFRGLTFSNFTEYGVAALAPRPTEALFEDCHWRVSVQTKEAHTYTYICTYRETRALLLVLDCVPLPVLLLPLIPTVPSRLSI